MEFINSNIICNNRTYNIFIYSLLFRIYFIFNLYQMNFIKDTNIMFILYIMCSKIRQYIC